MGVEIRTLGKLQIRLDGAEIPGLKRRKEQALLVYLTCQPGVNFAREHLQGLLWGESAPAQAANSLRQALSSLRKLLPPDSLLTDGTTVGWNPDGQTAVDVLALTDAPEKGTEPFLPGFVVRNAPLWEEWLEAERERLRLLALEGLLRRATEEADGNPQKAIGHLQQALALEPWRESSHRQLMWLHWRNSDRAAALQQYDVCVRMLADELGVPPSPETEDLARRIQAGDALFPTNLPDPTSQTAFVGRAAELADLAGLLRSQRLVTVTGLGGCGKTRLAQATGRALLSDFVDGVFYVELVGVEPAQFIGQVAAALDVTLAGAQAAEEQLARNLSDKNLLLILDNFEHLLRSPAPVRQIQALLAETAGLTLLVTSRERLNLHTEQVYGLHGLPVDDGQGPADGAVELFLLRASSASSRFSPGPAGHQVIQQICRLLEGMPLAIELAASWVRALSPQAILDEITGDINVLRTLHRDTPDRQRSLHAVLDATWRMLNRAEQRQLQALTVFRGSFERRAAASVADVTLFDLAGLIDKSLLYRLQGEGDEQDRYRLHEQLRQYAAAQAGDQADDQADDEAKVRARHAAHYAALLTNALPDLQGQAQQQAMADLGAELENVYAAWQHLLDQGAYDRLDACLEPLSLFFKIRSWMESGRQFLQEAELALPDVSGPILEHFRARVQLFQASFLEQMGRFQEATALLDTGLPVVAAHNDRRTEMFGLNVQATVAAKTGAYEDAATGFEDALAAAREVGDQFREAGILNNLGILCELQNQPERAMEWYDQSIRLHRAMNDDHGLAIALDNRGICAECLGLDDVAWNMFSESLAICRRLDYPEGINRALNNLGLIALDRERLDEARRLFQEAADVLERTGKAELIAYSQRFLSLVESRAGNVDQAIDLAQRSLAIFEQSEGEESIITGRTALGRVLWRAGQEREGRQLLLRALDRSVADQWPAAVADVLSTLIDLCREDDPQLAFALLCWLEYADLVTYLRRFRPESLHQKLAAQLTTTQREKWRAWAEEQTDRSLAQWLHQRLSAA